MTPAERIAQLEAVVGPAARGHRAPAEREHVPAGTGAGAQGSLGKAAYREPARVAIADPGRANDDEHAEHVLQCHADLHGKRSTRGDGGIVGVKEGFFRRHAMIDELCTDAVHAVGSVTAPVGEKDGRHAHPRETVRHPFGRGSSPSPHAREARLHYLTSTGHVQEVIPWQSSAPHAA